MLRYFIHHRTLANLTLVLLVAIGLISLDRIRTQFFPDFVIESVRITLPWPGAGAEDVDQRVVSQLEPALRAVDGVSESTASASEGSAQFRLEFAPGYDMTVALNEVESVINDARDLPSDLEPANISLGWFRDRVTNVVIYGDLSLDALERRAETLTASLFAAGITKTSIQGISEPRVTLKFDPQTLEKYGVTLNDAATKLAGSFGDQPAGTMAGDRVRLRTAGQPLDELQDFALIALDNGTRLTVRELASVEYEGLDRGLALYYQGLNAVQIQVDRGEGGDAISIQDSVQSVVDQFNAEAVDGVQARLVRARAQAIKDRLDILIENGITGLIIVVCLLFLFLSVRTAFWVTVGIPTAMLATIAMMLAFGLSLNMISLFALIICLGIVVDDAIVIGEHADHLHRQGHSPSEAAYLGAKRMFLPVLSSSITTIIAFSGMFLITGTFGRLVGDIPITVALVITASLVEVFLLLPAHMFHALKGAERGGPAWYDQPSLWVNKHFDRFREAIFKPLVGRIVTWRYPTLAIGLGLIMFSAAALMDKTVGWRFFNAPERGTLTGNLMMVEGSDRADTRAYLDQMASALLTVNADYQREYGREAVQSWLFQVGDNSGRPISGANRVNADRLGGFDVELIDPDLRPYSAFEFIRKWQDAIPASDAVDTLQFRGDRRGPGGDGVSVRLSGADFRVLKQASLALQNDLNRIAGVSAVEDDLPFDKTEQILSLTPEAQALGLTAAGLAKQLRDQLDGISALTLPTEGQSFEIRVAISDALRDQDYLQRARIPLPNGDYADLASLATWRSDRGFASLQVENGQRVIRVSGELADDPVQQAAIQTQIREQLLPALALRYGVNTEMSGLAQQEREFLSEAVVSFMVCVLAIYLTLTWIFSSWTRPLAPILTIPLGLVGVIWGHYAHGIPLSMFSVVGFIGMAGIILNDTIVLMVRIQELSGHQSFHAAIVQGASDRLRAVFLTSLTTVGGLTPLLFETSRQAQFLKPTVVTLAYGLGLGMVLVLLMTPAMLAIGHDIRRALVSARRAPGVIARARRIQALR